MRRIVTGALVLAAFAVLATALLWLGQRRLVYFPSQVVPSETPEGVVEVILTTSDGLELAAWFVPPRAGPGGPGSGAGAGTSDPADATTTARATIVVFHGNGGNRVGRVPLAVSLAERGHAVLLVDYRGYGGNPGSPTAAGLALDARAARTWVEEQDGLDGIDGRDGRDGRDAERIVYMGESLGAGVAIELAVDHPPAALVLRSPFTSLADVAGVHYPVVPTFLLRDRWPNLDRMGEVDAPALFIAGSDDEIVPADQTRRLHEAASEPKQLLVVDGARHNDRALLDGRDLVMAIDGFLADHVPPAS